MTSVVFMDFQTSSSEILGTTSFHSLMITLFMDIPQYNAHKEMLPTFTGRYYLTLTEIYLQLASEIELLA